MLVTVFVRRTSTLVAIAGLLIGFAAPAGASGSAKLSKEDAAGLRAPPGCGRTRRLVTIDALTGALTGVATDGPDTTPLSFKSIALGAQGCKAKKSSSS